jgi:hypothetical protein
MCDVMAVLVFCCECSRAVVINVTRRHTDAAAQGQELLWSTSESSLRVAIMETVIRCSAPLAAAATAATPPALQHSSDEDQRRLLLGKSDASRARGAQGEAEDVS